MNRCVLRGGTLLPSTLRLLWVDYGTDAPVFLAGSQQAVSLAHRAHRTPAM